MVADKKTRPQRHRSTRNDGEQFSLFLDFDGTLINLVDRFDNAAVPSGLPLLLVRTSHALGGRLALISGRRIADLDHLLHPYRGAAAGLHGLEWRSHAQDDTFPPQRLPAQVRAAVVAAAARYRARVEDKGAAIAVHTTGAANELEAIHAAINRLCSDAGGLWQCIQGRNVVELLPAGADKGIALQRLMTVRPFAGARPIAIGDDTTDLPMLIAAQRARGLPVCVGERISVLGATTLATPETVHSVLASIAQHAPRNINAMRALLAG